MSFTCSINSYIQGNANIQSKVTSASVTALYIPGTSGNYFDFGANSPAHFDTRSSTLFMEAWIYSLAANGSVNQQICAITDATGTDWNCFIGTDNIIHFGYWAPSYTQALTGTITFGAWNHVAVGWDFATRGMYVYLNGVATGPTTASTTGVYTPTRTFRIGSETTGSVFNGYIRDLRVIKGGTVPTTTFTPDSNPWRYNTIPSYVTGGTNVFGLYGQYLGNASLHTAPSCQIYVGPTGTTPSSYTTISAPTFTSSNVTFTGSTNVSGNYIDFGTTTINRSLGISIVATVNFRSSSTWQRICEIFSSGNNDNFGIAQDVTNNWLKFMFLANTATDYSVWSTAIPFTIGVPFTVVCIYNPNDVNGQRLSIYMNGALAGSTLWTAGTIPSSTITYTNAYVGRSAYAPDYYANMDLTFLKIYNRVLSSTEIGYLGASPQIYLAPTQYYPSYTVGSAPTISGSSFTFTGSTNVSGNYLNYPNTAFNMTNGFSFIATFYFTSSTQWQRLFDFGNGAPSDNILLAQSGTSTNFSFNVCSGTTQNIITAGTITFGTYQTVAGVYDPSILNFKMYLYVNGTLVGSLAPTSRISGTRTLTNCYIGRSNWAADYYANMSLTFLNMYNRVLTPDEIANPPSGAIISVTATPRLSSIPNMNYSGIALLSQLSPTAQQSAMGIFGLRAINGNVVKAVNIRRSSDNATQDFYADRLGNLLTTPVTGQPLASWLGGATAYVTTWYDQSSQNNNATQGTSANQPSVSLTGLNSKPMVYWGGINNVILNATNGINTPTFTAVMVLNMAMKTTNVQQWFNTTSWVAGSLSYTSQQNLRNIFVQTNPSAGTQLSYTYTDNVPYIFIIVGTVSGGTATVTPYVNGTAYAADSASGVTNFQMQSMGFGGWGGDGVRTYNGGMSDIYMYSTALSTTDRQYIEGYLAWKVVSSGSILPVNHPYYSVAPSFG